MKYKSRFLDVQKIHISSQRIPSEFHKAVSYAEEWCLTDDEEIDIHNRTADLANMEQFVAVCDSINEKMRKYCFEISRPSPLPDEVVLIEIIYNNYLCAKAALKVRKMS